MRLDRRLSRRRPATVAPNWHFHLPPHARRWAEFKTSHHCSICPSGQLAAWNRITRVAGVSPGTTQTRSAYDICRSRGARGGVFATMLSELERRRSETWSPHYRSSTRINFDRLHYSRAETISFHAAFDTSLGVAITWSRLSQCNASTLPPYWSALLDVYCASDGSI